MRYVTGKFSPSTPSMCFLLPIYVPASILRFFLARFLFMILMLNPPRLHACRSTDSKSQALTVSSAISCGLTPYRISAMSRRRARRVCPLFSSLFLWDGTFEFYRFLFFFLVLLFYFIIAKSPNYRCSARSGNDVPA
jgi:hypothetical protein